MNEKYIQTNDITEIGQHELSISYYQKRKTISSGFFKNSETNDIEFLEYVA